MLFLDGVSFYVEVWGGVSLGAKFVSMFAQAFVLYVVFLSFKLDVFIPRDEPLRFNRVRRKVYVYDFNYVWWNPFVTWRVTTKSYNWDDLRAEEWKLRGITPHGGLIIKWGVSVAVIKPGTNQVVDRFHLSTFNVDSVWVYICAYMQRGTEVLPSVAEFNDPNRVSPFNVALRLAPKVTWPEDIEIESRTVP